MPVRLGWVLLGASAIYVAGMFLNDACDAGFDRRHRAERPIPMGWVPEWQVWLAGLGLLLAGGAVLAELGPPTALLALGLVMSVLVYDMTHKVMPGGPVLMALCRVLLFLAAGSAAADGVTGDVAWCGLVLGVYVVGLSYVARRESSGVAIRPWPLPALAAPFVLAVFLNPPSDWALASLALPAVLLAAWIGRSLLALSGRWPGGAKGAVSGMLAGIALVDALAVAAPLDPWGAVFLGLFGMALILQQRVPAT